MPRVPRRERSVGVGGLAAPSLNVQVPELQVGSTQGLNQATQTVSRNLQKFVANERRKADDLAIMEFSAKALKIKNELIYNPKTGFQRAKGGAVLKEDFITNQESLLASGLEQASGGLIRNRRQQAVADSIKSRIGSEFNERLQKHVFNETNRYADEVLGQTLEAANDDAIQNWQDPGKIDQSIGLTVGALRTHAQDYGKSKEWLDNQTEKLVSNIHAGVIDSMLASKEYVIASDYFKNNKEEIRGETRNKIKGAIETGNDREESQRRTREIVNKSGTNLTVALREVDKIKDAKVKDDVRSRVKQRISDIKFADQENQKEIFDQSSKIVRESRDIHEIKPTIWNSFTDSEQQRLRDIAANKGASNPTLFYNLADKLNSQDINVRKSVYNSDLSKHVTSLGESLFLKLNGLASAAKKADQEGKGVPTFNAADKRIQDEVIGTHLNINPNSKDARNPKNSVGERVALFRRLYQEQIEAEAEGPGGKPLTTEDRIAIAKGLAIKAVIGEGIKIFPFPGRTNKTKSLFELDFESPRTAVPPAFVIGGKKFDFPVSEIPKNDRSRVIRSLKIQGRLTTEQNIKETWLLFKFGGISINAD